MPPSDPLLPGADGPVSPASARGRHRREPPPRSVPRRRPQEPLEEQHTAAPAATTPEPGSAPVEPRRRRRRPRLSTVLIWTAGGVALLVILATVGALWISQRSFPQTTGTISVAGLDGAVTVLRDAYGVPQVYASTSADLFFAQGFVHAQDRFWEMDVRRHITSGRLAELFGEDQVETDAVIRTMDWRGVAEQELAVLEPETVEMLEAYAAGVNAYIGDRSKTELSFEYAVLGLTNRGVEIEPWTPVDSLAWLKAMAWDLRGNMQEEAERSLIAATVGLERTEQLYPDYPYAEHAPIVTTGTVVGDVFDPAATAAPATPPAAEPPPAAARAALQDATDRMALVPELLGPAGDGLGSNSWVLAGSRTASGKPLLANDPHLGPQLPSIWYQMGLHCTERSDACPYDVSGFTFSGLPGVVIGHNDRIAWGFTNLGPDVSDLYLEKVTGEEYLVGAEQRPLVERRETIEVAGGEPQTVVVRSTDHGPIISSVLDEAEEVGEKALVAGDISGTPPARGSGYAVSLAWTALQPGRTADAIRLLNTAQDWEEFRAAAERFEVPAQNLVYADVDGNIGYQAPGTIPVRGAGDGRYPSLGWDPAYDWTGTIPFAQLPYVLNPESGYVVTANNAVIGADYPKFLGDDWSWGSRSQRIIDLVEDAGDGLTVDVMQTMQSDNWYEAADVLLPVLDTVAPDGGDTRDAYSLLTSWDLQMDGDSAAAAYFAGVWRSLMAVTFDDELPDDHRASGGDRWVGVVTTLLQSPDDAWWDDVDTPERETRDDTLRRVLDEAYAEISGRLGDDPEEWRWDDLHTLELENQTLGQSGISLVERMFNRGPVPLGGGRSIVNATGWTAYDGYAVDWVPSMRMVVDLADLDASRWVNLTGASGHTWHDNYWDQTALWRDGDSTPWPFTPDAVEAASDQRLELTPDR